MLAKDLISEVVPVIRTSDTGLQVLNWMEIFRVSHLPIVNNKEFLGLISDTDIYDLNMADEPIGNHKLSLFAPFVMHSQHIYEVISLAAKHKLSVVPVLDENKEYIGLVTQADLVRKFSKLSASSEPGSIVVLELNQRDYSLSLIAQIVESENAKILSLYIDADEDTTRMDVILKLNRTDIRAIVQSFIRHDYIVKASYSDEDSMDSFYSNRYDSFMNYLNI